MQCLVSTCILSLCRFCSIDVVHRAQDDVATANAVLLHASACNNSALCKHVQGTPSHHALVDDAPVAQDAVDGGPAGWAALEVLKAFCLWLEAHCLACTPRMASFYCWCLGKYQMLCSCQLHQSGKRMPGRMAVNALHVRTPTHAKIVRIGTCQRV